jgi:hypothetical protein
MAYRILSSDSQKFILERESAAVKSGIFISVGALFFLIGVGLNVFMTSWEMPYLLFRILFPLFGLLAIWAGSYLPKQVQESQPERITFDHNQGAVVVEMKAGDNQKGFIRYDEIVGFDIYVESRSSSSSSSRSSRTYYWYHVFLKKKDGGEWYLFDYGERSQAETMITKIASQIPLDRPFRITTTPQLSSKIEKKDGLDKTIIHWQNKVGWWQPVFLIGFSVIFLSILFSFFTFGVDMGAFEFIVIGFILSVFLLVMFTAIRKLIKEATTRYAVSIDHTNLEYYEFTKSTGVMKNKKALPLTEVQSINYSYTPTKQYQDGGLKILTKNDYARIEEVSKKPLEAFRDLFSSGNKPIILSITALNPVECPQLENWLQELILKKSSVKVS